MLYIYSYWLSFTLEGEDLIYWLFSCNILLASRYLIKVNLINYQILLKFKVFLIICIEHIGSVLSINNTLNNLTIIFIDVIINRYIFWSFMFLLKEHKSLIVSTLIMSLLGVGCV